MQTRKPTRPAGTTTTLIQPTARFTLTQPSRPAPTIRRSVARRRDFLAMQCPSCNSLSPDDVRFCLHCGRFLGEPDDTTQVRTPRTPPPSTIRTDFVPFSPSTTAYERPRRRRWPGVVALSVLAGIVLMVAGGLIAVSLIHDTGGVSVALPNNTRLNVLATPTPTIRA